MLSINKIKFHKEQSVKKKHMGEDELTVQRTIYQYLVNTCNVLLFSISARKWLYNF